MDDFNFENSTKYPHVPDYEVKSTSDEFNQFFDEKEPSNDELSNIESVADNYNEKVHGYTTYIEDYEVPVDNSFNRTAQVMFTTNNNNSSFNAIPVESSSKHTYNPFGHASSNKMHDKNSKRSSLPVTAHSIQPNDQIQHDRRAINLDPFSKTSQGIEDSSTGPIIVEGVKRMTISNFNNFSGISSATSQPRSMTGYMAEKVTFYTPHAENCLRIDGTCKSSSFLLL